MVKLRKLLLCKFNFNRFIYLSYDRDDLVLNNFKHLVSVTKFIL